MTREEIKNITRIVDLMLDASVTDKTREKLLKRLDEVCNLAIRALEQEPLEVEGTELQKAYNQGVEGFRQAVLDYIYNDLGLGDEENGKDVERQMELESSYRYVKSLPPVIPQPKIGRWMKEQTIHGWDGYSYQCSECGRSIHLDIDVENLSDYPYCHCGAKMQEVEE